VQTLLPILLEGIWLAGEARRRSIALTSVTEEQRSQRAKAPQPSGAGRHRAICVVPRSVEYLWGYTPSLGPRIWPGGAPAKTGINFCTDPYLIAALPRPSGNVGQNHRRPTEVGESH